jgi:hypothetical protein
VSLRRRSAAHLTARFSGLDFPRRGANVVLAARTAKADDQLPGTIGEHASGAGRYGGLDISVAVPMTVPARMLVYFAACENPWEYTGRLFWAEREMADMGIALDQ